MRRFASIGFLFFNFIFIAHASAQEKAGPDLKTCDAQLKIFCTEVNSPDASIKCLLKHREELALECKTSLERFFRANEQASDQDGGALTGIGAISAITPPFPFISYDGRIHAKENSESDERLKISTPVFQNKTDYLALSANGSWLHFGDPVTLSSGKVLSTDFYRTEIGAQYSHQLPEHRTYGIRATIGYASDQLFQSFSDTTFSLTGHYGFPGSGPGYWMLTVFWSNNSPFLSYVPIPGFIYLYRTSTFTGVFGFPIISMQWTPLKPWLFSLSAFGPAVTAEVGYGSPRFIQAFTDFKWENQTFFPRVRDDHQDRLTIEQKNVSIGARSLLIKGLLSELQAGYDFERMLYIGDKFRNTREGVAYLDGGFFLSWSLKAAL